MAALRRRMQVLRKTWPDNPLPPPLVTPGASHPNEKKNRKKKNEPYKTED
jgi:hypothetical protein